MLFLSNFSGLQCTMHTQLMLIFVIQHTGKKRWRFPDLQHHLTVQNPATTLYMRRLHIVHYTLYFRRLWSQLAYEAILWIQTSCCKINVLIADRPGSEPCQPEPRPGHPLNVGCGHNSPTHNPLVCSWAAPVPSPPTFPHPFCWYTPSMYCWYRLSGWACVHLCKQNQP